jgi:uncharacterized membrane protein YtjA (UPF0391 family)
LEPGADGGACARRLQSLHHRSMESTMLKWALIFAVIAVVAGLFGFTGVAAGAAGVAKFLFFVFVALFVLALVLGATVFKAVK